MNKKSMGGISIKGTRQGITIIINGGEPKGALEDLAKQLASSGHFLRGNEVVLEIGSDYFGVQELEALCGLLKRYDMNPVKVISESPDVRRAAQALGLEANKPTAKRPEYALVKRGPIRSGQSVNYDGTVLIIGDVNPGGEVIAGGDIIVWGHLKGMAYAGAPDDSSRRIYALSLEPTLLRIGNYLARPPEGETSPGKGPETAFVQENQIVVEPWEH